MSKMVNMVNIFFCQKAQKFMYFKLSDFVQLVVKILIKDLQIVLNFQC